VHGYPYPAGVLLLVAGGRTTFTSRSASGGIRRRWVDGTLVLVFLHNPDGARHCCYCGNESEEGTGRPRGRAQRVEDAERIGEEGNEHQEPLECRQPDEHLPVVRSDLGRPAQGAAQHVQHGDDGHHEDQVAPAPGNPPSALTLNCGGVFEEQTAG
jgi:hypothetical protein